MKHMSPALFCSGCCTNCHRLCVTYQIQKFISHSSGGQEGQGQGAGTDTGWQELSSWARAGTFLLCPHAVEGVRELSGVSLVRVLIPFPGAPASQPNRLPKAHTPPPSHRALGISAHGFKETQLFRPQHCPNTPFSRNAHTHACSRTAFRWRPLRPADGVPCPRPPRKHSASMSNTHVTGVLHVEGQKATRGQNPSRFLRLFLSM
ncbi:hypothetical protein HJG60_008806 [Phyllostomus discolor]|uniref:Uncharacterized protein n=1 Tax=Phyllostomus discolor TaxID=89673 RepID=A0A834DL45_9CHIR|nr:hypothetical protein HJG60_008806 [Phyllostomus discolor]